MESAGTTLVFTTPNHTQAAMQALLWEESENEPWVCMMWASAACRTHISAFIFVNYSGNDGAATRQKLSFPSPDCSEPLPAPSSYLPFQAQAALCLCQHPHPIYLLLVSITLPPHLSPPLPEAIHGVSPSPPPCLLC